MGMTVNGYMNCKRLVAAKCFQAYARPIEDYGKYEVGWI